MIDVRALAAQADFIVNGFAVIPCTEGYKVVNLNNARGVAVFSSNGMLIETNMDDIELSIAQKVLAESFTYAEI